MDPSEDVIARFYDEHPYPPPPLGLDDYQRRWSDPGRLRADHHLIWPDRPLTGELDVLVAGCGTSQAARHAMRRPDARVVGIDVSAASLQATEELRTRHRLENVELRQLPIEQVADLDRTFDLVVCTGVLHHLADPDAGLRALAGVLRRGGAMQLMVYGRYGRAGVVMMQDYSRLLGIGTSRDEIIDLAKVLVELPAAHPLVPLLRGSPDFRRIDAIADALLNPRDRSYSVPEVLDYLDRNGLAFGRWQRQAPYLPQCGILATLPHADALMGLPVEEQYAAVELFRGTMTTHSPVAYRVEDGPPPVVFQGDDWLDAIPIAVPDTVLVEERLPPGAAAVVINPAHTHTDLVLSLDVTERSLYGAIDGIRTVAEIGAGADTGTVAGLFENLWRYDQVVFDVTSRVGS